MKSWEEKIANNMYSNSCESRNPVGNKRVDSRLHGNDNVGFCHSSDSSNQEERKKISSRCHGNDRTSECLSFAIMNILIIKKISAFARMTFNKKSIFQMAQYNL